MRQSLLAILIFTSCFRLQAQTWQPTWESLDKRPVPQWFKDAKFGIFIHWGVYSVPGWSSKGQYAEWYQNGLNSGDTDRIKYQKEKFGDLNYYQLADQFKAELYNPDEWAQLIEKSGARYVVLTSKHHDGFANWPSKEASKDWGLPWNSVETGPHRDLLGDLFTAIRKTSVHPGMYYSLYEWYNPLWLKDKPRYVSAHMWPQMQELITKYQPEVFWTDGDWDASDSLWKSRQFLAWLYNESAVKDKIVTYDRWGSGIRFHHGGVYTPEYQPNLDFADHYWEESRGMGFSYGYNRQEDAWDYNSSKALVFQLIDKVSRGGNFLLDIGPDEHGKIPPIMQERLLEIGDWMKINSEAIYGSTRWKVSSQWSEGRQDYTPASGGGDLLLKLTVDPDPGYAVKECFFTYNADRNDLYVILPKWHNSFTVHNLPLSNGTKIELLETHESINWHQNGNDLVMDLPTYDPNKISSQFGYIIKIHNTGAFTPKPVVHVDYPGNALRPVVTVDAQPGVQYYYTLDEKTSSSPAGNGKLYTAPFSPDRTAVLSVQGTQGVKAVSEKGAILASEVVSIPLTVFDWKKAEKISGLHAGLQVKAYEGSIRSVSDMDKLSPVRSGSAAKLSTSDLSRKENAGLIYDGFLKVPTGGIYTFYLSSDDGSSLMLDDVLTINNDGFHGNEERSGRAALKAGLHRFKLSYFNGGGDGNLTLQYSRGKGDKLPVPAAWFYSK